MTVVNQEVSLKYFQFLVVASSIPQKKRGKIRQMAIGYCFPSSHNTKTKSHGEMKISRVPPITPYSKGGSRPLSFSAQFRAIHARSCLRAFASSWNSIEVPWTYPYIMGLGILKYGIKRDLVVYCDKRALTNPVMVISG